MTRTFALLGLFVLACTPRASPDAGVGIDAGVLDAGDSAPDAGCDTPCNVATDCIPTWNSCAQSTCMSGCCATANEPARMPCGDGQVCDGAGNCVECLTRQDCPPAYRECEADECVNGTCIVEGVGVGNACSEAGGSVCDGKGACVQCVSPSDCPPTMTSCAVSSCISNECVTTSTQTGQSCSDNGGQFCDGQGHCVACLSASDCTQVSDGCMTSACISNACTQVPLPGGRPCFGTPQGQGICNPQGMCVECLGAQDCPTGPGTVCFMPTCERNLCGLVPSSKGEACIEPPIGSDGECDGSGKCTFCHDGQQNASETDVDCGGNCDAFDLTCANGKGCITNADCTSGECSPLMAVCVTPACGDDFVSPATGEQCDQGSSNGAPGDGCSSTCQLLSGKYSNEVEPNDTPATGNVVDGYAGAVGELSPDGDVDCYLVTVTVPDASLAASIGDGFGGCPSSFQGDAVITLTGPSIPPTMSSFGGGAECAAMTPLPVTSGKYSLCVSSLRATPQPYYVLDVQVMTPP